MKTTLTALRVDFGAVGGHLQPSELFVSSVRAFVEEKTDNFLIDCRVNFTGDDINHPVHLRKRHRYPEDPGDILGCILKTVTLRVLGNTLDAEKPSCTWTKQLSAF